MALTVIIPFPRKPEIRRVPTDGLPPSVEATAERGDGHEIIVYFDGSLPGDPADARTPAGAACARAVEALTGQRRRQTAVLPAAMAGLRAHGTTAAAAGVTAAAAGTAALMALSVLPAASHTRATGTGPRSVPVAAGITQASPAAQAHQPGKAATAGTVREASTAGRAPVAAQRQHRTSPSVQSFTPAPGAAASSPVTVPVPVPHPSPSLPQVKVTIPLPIPPPPVVRKIEHLVCHLDLLGIRVCVRVG